MRWGMWGAAAIVLLIVVVIIVRQVVLPAFEDDDVPGGNSTWLEFAWTTEPVNGTAVKQLGERLESNYIDRVYLESSAWRGDGSLIEGEYAAEFTAALRKAYPSVEILLWLRMSGEQIAQPEQQSMVTALAHRAVHEWKFDGVQLNGRTVLNDSEAFIQLLRGLREVIGEEALLSVTVPPDRIPVDPDIPIGSTTEPELTWDMNYKQRVGLLLVDEIVVMAHASGLDNAADYETWVAYQVENYVTTLAELENPVPVVVALPTYDAAPEHDPEVESVRAAIRGVQRGRQRAGDNKKWIKSVGLYEYKTTDSREWALYQQHWLGLESD
jgi:hypothetical protein